MVANCRNRVVTAAASALDGCSRRVGVRRRACGPMNRVVTAAGWPVPGRTQNHAPRARRRAQAGQAGGAAWKTGNGLRSAMKVYRPFVPPWLIWAGLGFSRMNHGSRASSSGW